VSAGWAHGFFFHHRRAGDYTDYLSGILFEDPLDEVMSLESRVPQVRQDQIVMALVVMFGRFVTMASGSHGMAGASQNLDFVFQDECAVFDEKNLHKDLTANNG